MKFLKLLKNWQKSLRRYLTIILIPHSSTRTIRITFTLSFVIFVFLLWSSLTIWAGYVTGRHFEYWKVKLDREVIRFKLLFFADQVRKSQEMLEQVKERDLQLRALLDMKTRKEIIMNESKGGPSPKDQLYLEKILSKKVHELKVQDLNRQSTLLHKETGNRLESITQIENFITYQSALYNATPNIWPVRGRITSPFGFRRHPIASRSEYHKGIDIANRRGTKIYATADGVVKFAGWTSGFGRIVIINHGYNYQTYYGHLLRLQVKKGEKVRRGQVIGLMGRSGLATGVHVHYEIRYKGKATNPYRFLDRDNFFKRGVTQNVWEKTRRR